MPHVFSKRWTHLLQVITNTKHAEVQSIHTHTHRPVKHLIHPHLSSSLNSHNSKLPCLWNSSLQQINKLSFQWLDFQQLNTHDVQIKHIGPSPTVQFITNTYNVLQWDEVQTEPACSSATYNKQSCRAAVYYQCITGCGNTVCSNTVFVPTFSKCGPVYIRFWLPSTIYCRKYVRFSQFVLSVCGDPCFH